MLHAWRLFASLLLKVRAAALHPLPPPSQFFATKTDASALRMLNGSPAERLLKPITDYIEARYVFLCL